jgi:hypothetical protein
LVSDSDLRQFVVELDCFGEDALTYASLAESLSIAHDSVVGPLIEYLDLQDIPYDHSIMKVDLEDNVRHSKYTSKSWRAALAEFSAGALMKLFVGALRLDGPDPARYGGPILDLSVTRGGETPPPRSAHVLRLQVSPTMQPGWLTAEREAMLIEFARERAAAIHAVYGYVTLDLVRNNQSPYENRVGVLPYQTLPHVKIQTRGYYWANFLSTGHIDRLGGVEQVKRDAPVAVAEERVVNKEVQMYLQLTDHVWNVSEGELIALRKYLQPLLPAGRQRRYTGPRLLLVEDPWEAGRDANNGEG